MARFAMTFPAPDMNRRTEKIQKCMITDHPQQFSEKYWFFPGKAPGYPRGVPTDPDEHD
jgi:hypothetical protein